MYGRKIHGVIWHKPKDMILEELCHLQRHLVLSMESIASGAKVIVIFTIHQYTRFPAKYVPLRMEFHFN
jgi:hypothetical protein